MNRSRFLYHLVIRVAALVFSAASVLTAQPVQRPFSPCDVVSYISIGAQGEHYLLAAISEPGISFDPKRAFLDHLRKISSREFYSQFSHAERGHSSSEFPCDEPLYQHVARAAFLASSARPSDGSEQHGARTALTDAEKEWREAIHLQPNNPLLHIGFAETLGLGKRWREQSKEGEAAIRLGAQISAAHAMPGGSLTMRAYQEDRSPNGDPNRVLLQRAAEELSQAVALAPKNCFLRSTFAITLIAERDFVRADSESGIAEKQCPYSTYTIWVGANSIAEQGNTNAAIVKLRAGLQKAPGCPLLWRYLSDLLMSQGDAHSARTIEEAAKKAPPPEGAACPTMLAK
jgi:hypothetical protein